MRSAQQETPRGSAADLGAEIADAFGMGLGAGAAVPEVDISVRDLVAAGQRARRRSTGRPVAWRPGPTRRPGRRGRGGPEHGLTGCDETFEPSSPRQPPSPQESDEALDAILSLEGLWQASRQDTARRLMRASLSSVTSQTSGWGPETAVACPQRLRQLQGKNCPLFLKITRVVTACATHIQSCPTCSKSAERCPICASSAPLYPFEVETFHACSQCKAVFHKACFLAPSVFKKLHNGSPRWQRCKHADVASGFSSLNTVVSEMMAVNENQHTGLPFFRCLHHTTNCNLATFRAGETDVWEEVLTMHLWVDLINAAQGMSSSMDF
eukprot:g15787.t1